MKRLVLFVCILLSFSTGWAQTKIIDSLKKQYSAASTAPEKLDLLLALCEERNSLSADSLLSFAINAKAMALKLHQPDKILLSLYYTAAAFEKKNLPDSTLALISKGILQTKKNKQFSSLHRKFLYLKGTVLLRQNEFKGALAAFFDLLKQSEQVNDLPNQVIAKGAIGWAYMEMGQPKEAMVWFQKTLHTATSQQGKNLIATYINMAAVYGMMEQYDSVEYCIDIAIARARKYEMLTFLSNALNLKASLYMTTQRNPRAEPLLNEALDIRKHIGDPFYIVADLAQLASYYSNEGNPDKAIALSEEGIALAMQNRITSKLPMLYISLAHAYKQKGDIQNYSLAVEKNMAIKDSLYQASTAEAIAELEARYQLQKKENTIILQEIELIKQDYMLAGAAILIVLISGVGIFSFINYRKKQRIRLEQIREEEKIRAAKAIKDAEEKERKRIAADLHDNLGAYAASIAYNLEHVMQYNGDNRWAMDELRNNSQAMVAELSDTIWALKKDALHLTAISDRMKTFVQNLKNTYTHIDMEVEEVIENDVLLSPSQAFHLLRIIQEAVNNAVKHSACDRIVITIKSHDLWKVVVRDNGKGIKNISDSSGNGLFNMRQRSEVCGWNIRWQANLEKGTDIIISSTTN